VLKGDFCCLERLDLLTLINPASYSHTLANQQLHTKFMEMWIHNDGFLHRIAQLSQDEAGIDDSTLEALRKDLKKEKALDIANTIFLSALQLAVFETFDPRGDETLVSLQSRLAQRYLPRGNMPDSSDLSPLLAVFQEHGVDQLMSAYAPLWSEILGAMVFESFQKTDLRDLDEVERLGLGVRDLFLRSDQSMTTKRVEDLCRTPISTLPLKHVYQFGSDIEEEIPSEDSKAT
jgi:Peptidase family M3